jgi:hypothetical protein
VTEILGLSDEHNSCALNFIHLSVSLCAAMNFSLFFLYVNKIIMMRKKLSEDIWVHFALSFERSRNIDKRSTFNIVVE